MQEYAGICRNMQECEPEHTSLLVHRKEAGCEASGKVEDKLRKQHSLETPLVFWEERVGNT